MREIKFRAWDKDNNKMIYQSPYYAYQLMITMDGGYMYRDGKRCNYDMMQYTGLKDKNGVEIYEGDVVKWADTIGVVKYKPTRFLNDMQRCDLMGNYRLDTFEGAIEVIGNIYEHPHLIKENKSCQ